MSGSRFLSPEAIARVKGLKYRSRRVVDGLLQGIHRSPHHGSSIEFSEHKEYAPGDDVRHIDWKAYGRLDKYTVKRFEHESNLNAWFLIDGSGSMAYGADGQMSKYEYGAVLGASLAHLYLQQQDAVGLGVVSEKEQHTLAARSRLSHINQFCDTIESLTPSGACDLAPMIDAVGARASRRGLVFLMTDLLGDMEATFEALSHWVGKGHQVHLFHLLDADELHFPFQEMTLFLGMESKRKLLVEPRVIRRMYLQRLEAYMEACKVRCLKRKIVYRLVNTGLPPEEVLLDFLATQNRRAAG